jgi:Siphovirus ReqiPepy6 Gp37-like protein
MRLWTLNPSFQPQNEIDEFISAIWTERYYGDSDLELVVPLTRDMLDRFQTGVFVALEGTEEAMILETREIEGGNLKLSGISLLAWMNNRFIRTRAGHNSKVWSIKGQTAGHILWMMIYNMCHPNSPYLDGTINTNVPERAKLAIEGLKLIGYDDTGKKIKNKKIPYGPLYDGMRQIAVNNRIGMTLRVQNVTDSSYELGFLSYRGLNRTSTQTNRPTIRFSPLTDTFTDIREIQSIALLKTIVYAYATGPVVTEPPDPADAEVLTNGPGVAKRTEVGSGFNRRAMMILVDDIENSELDSSTLAAKKAEVVDLLDDDAHAALDENKKINLVDGTISETGQYRYGKDYHLGDEIEVQGLSGTVQNSRIIEYIRSQDAAGEKAYPTVIALADEGE